MERKLNLRICSACLAMISALSLMAETVNLNFFVNGTKIKTQSVTSGGTYTLADYVSDASMDEYECRDYSFVGWKQGEPVMGDETPSTPATITPTHNVNLYAVFRRGAGAVNRYVRVTSLDNLHSGSQYLIVCYYMYGGEPQYYALGNQESTYTYSNNNYYKINAERLYPRSGVIVEPDANLVWTLNGSAGAWKWTNAAASKGLVVNNNRTNQNHMLQAVRYATTCAISVANGIFTIEHSSNGWALRYVPDEITETDDYFITQQTSVATSYPFYLYEKESPYTSYLDCSPWTVYVDAIEGAIVGKTPASARDTLTEVSPQSGVTLPSAEKTDDGCDGWVFSGWSVDEAIEGQTATPANLITGTYTPLYNGVTLYGVYHGTRTTVKYTKVTTGTVPANGDYLIVAETGGNYYALGNVEITSTTSTEKDIRYSVEPIPVVVNASGEIEGQHSSDIEWTYNSRRFHNKGNTSIYVNPHFTGSGTEDNPYLDYILGSAVDLSFYRSGEKWAIYRYYDHLTFFDGEFINSYNESSYYYHLYLFKKSTTTTTIYTSYPHCAPYTVTLHACGGTFDGGGNIRAMTEMASGTGITLPSSVVPTCGDDWTFCGWFEGEELPSTYDTCFVDYHKPGTLYFPKTADEHLCAVYRRETDKFLIIHGLKELVSGDTYLITHYAREDGDESGKVYDWLLSSEQYDANHLKGEKGVAPQNGAGYYMQTSDSAVMWTISGSNHDWAVQNLKNNEYLQTYTTGETKTQAEDNSTIIYDRGDGFALTIGCVAASTYYDIWYNGSYYATKEETYTTENDKKYYSPFCYVYRREKEYASYPHCDAFTVHFQECGGSAPDGAITEEAVYAGIELPDAYANADCAKEGWTFAGWAEAPVTEETDLQTFDLYPAHTIYHPVSSTDTLYAVYHLKSNHFKRIQTVSRLHTGVNYIVTRVNGSEYALKNLPDSEVSPTAVKSSVVSPDAQIITNDDASIEWLLLGSVGEYELYNAARQVYLDLSEPGEALLPKTSVDQFDITYSDAKAYCVRSCMSIAGSDGRKYLGYSSNFTSVTNDDRPTIYFYRQQSTYNSYPSCIVETDALKWETDASGSYVYVESYHLTGAPDMNGGLSDAELQSDGTYRIKYDPSALTPCSNARVEWGGTSTELRIPYVVTADANSSTMLGGGDCSTCDVYVIPGKTLTIDADKEVNTLTVADGATLNIANGTKLTVTSLILFSEGDQSAPIVNLNNSGSIVLKHDELYHDRRMDESRYFWFTLPFDAQLQQISYANEAANGKQPTYREDYFLKFYNGALRSDDANGGVQASTYWTHVAPKGGDYALRAGQGYIIGIADQATAVQADGKRHTKRVMRFTMRPDTTTWLTQERTGGTKSTDVAPATARDPRNAVHVGWNLIGNPFMHTYNTGDVDDNSGLTNGVYVKELDAKGDWTGFYVKSSDPETDVPYFTLYDPSQPAESRYSQVLAANYNLRPFEAVFVQISEGEQLNFASAMNASSAPAYRRAPAYDAPLYTGIMLTGNGRSDRAGIVLSEEYTPAYEICADLAKQFNKGGLNLYTLNPDKQELAFNAMADEDAVEAIPVGVSIPKAGEYTFAFDAQQYNMQALESLQLIDEQLNTTVNLLETDYTYTAGAGTVNDRFYLLVRRAKQAPEVATDNGINTSGQADEWTKIIRDGQLYIRRGNRMYDATGRTVR